MGKKGLQKESNPLLGFSVGNRAFPARLGQADALCQTDFVRKDRSGGQDYGNRKKKWAGTQKRATLQDSEEGRDGSGGVELKRRGSGGRLGWVSKALPPNINKRGKRYEQAIRPERGGTVEATCPQALRNRKEISRLAFYDVYGGGNAKRKKKHGVRCSLEDTQ